MKWIIAAVAVLVLVASVVHAAPSPPTSVDVVQSTRRTSFGSGNTTVEAFAGNVTQLTITGTTVTKRWQGYYGNVTGGITLGDADNNTFFSWGALANPEGEVYMANNSVTSWPDVQCANFSINQGGTNCHGAGTNCLNLSEIETGYGMGAADNDGVNETFNQTLASMLVGTVTVAGCPMVNLFENGSVSTTWNESLLTINNTDTVIFASIIDSGTFGFNNQTMDFQMIVGEDGDDAVTTTYFAYVELA